MAHYTVTFSCGHTETIQLFGKIADRERRIAWLENNGVCSECYRKAQAEQRARATAEAAEATADLPQLQGTEKQIAWATVIRAKAAALGQAPIRAYMENILAGIHADNPQQYSRIMERLKVICADRHFDGVMDIYRQHVAMHDDCRYWIDSRDLQPRTLVEEIIAELSAEDQE